MKTKALVIRTEMCGGGTSYDVLFRCQDKPSRPLHGYTYATVIMRDTERYYAVDDAIDPQSRWSMDYGIEKWDAGQKLRKVASRLAYRIAARAFPELRQLGKLPSLWASWTMPSAQKWVEVNMELPA